MTTHVLVQRLASVLGLCALTFALLPHATADNWGEVALGGCNDVGEADNATHNFDYVDLTAHMTAATDWVRANNIDPTDMNTSMDPTPDVHTDVIVRDRHYVDYCGKDWMQPGGQGIVGLATCDWGTAGLNCDQHTVRYNNNFTDIESTSNRRGLACHENGHAVGLEHRDSTSCIDQGYPKAINDYSDHDRNHINDNF